MLLAGCPGRGAELPPDLPAVGGQVSLLRVPRHGGLVEAYDPDSLGEPIWTSRTEAPRIREVLGVSAETRLLFAVDTAKNLFTVDLESRGIRTQATGIEAAVMVADGSVFTVNAARRVSRLQAGLPTLYRPPLPVAPVFHTGTLGDRYIAVLGTKPRRLLILGAERQLASLDAPDGEPAATYWGDQVAVAKGREVVLFQTEDPFPTRSFEAGAPVRHIVFSPSGHRIYLAHDDQSIEVIDRYALDRLATLELPGVPRRLRTDQSGRWLLARPADGDSAWVVDLATGRLVMTADTEWDDDLPTVAGAATLVTRRRGDLVTVGLGQPDHPELGRIVGGAADLWVVTPWLPKERLTRAVAAAESILVAQDSLLVADSQAVAPTTDRIFLQVSSSQNAEWSREYAKQLTTAGYPAQVLDPGSADEGYRVVVGPYATREAAEETGRKLGRPYFILTNPPIKQ
ncbi:MAG: SPOR domain-containing protein [Gemmatimonadetes bacterium]|nr:SPOR domain-containing protein [Gemmatimonadota bacterium]